MLWVQPLKTKTKKSTIERNLAKSRICEDWSTCYKTTTGSKKTSKQKSLNIWRQLKTKTLQNLCNETKVAVRGKFTTTQAYLKKQEKSQSSLIPKETRNLRTNETLKLSEEIKIRVKINEIEKKTI